VSESAPAGKPPARSKRCPKGSLINCLSRLTEAFDDHPFRTAGAILARADVLDAGPPAANRCP
jgi:hypothetical protein